MAKEVPVYVSGLSPLVLAYIGDAVYELLVRVYLVKKGLVKTEKLHSEAVRYTRATSQARLVALLEDFLTPQEKEVLRRGRNARPGHQPRHIGALDYRYATALESLIGHLYLCGNRERLEEIFSLIVRVVEKDFKL
ncbi:MAG: mini-ribonuclease [Clostridia bacterium]|nr:mini-ribonuclease [Clostridia bacterium]